MLKYLPGDLNLLHFKVQDKAIKYQDLLNQLIRKTNALYYAKNPHAKIGKTRYI
jgi:hypothetical protein